MLPGARVLGPFISKVVTGSGRRDRGGLDGGVTAARSERVAARISRSCTQLQVKFALNGAPEWDHGLSLTDGLCLPARREAQAAPCNSTVAVRVEKLTHRELCGGSLCRGWPRRSRTQRGPHAEAGAGVFRWF